MHTPMILRSISLPPEYLAAAKALASADGVSFAEVIRRALAEYLERHHGA